MTILNPICRVVAAAAFFLIAAPAWGAKDKPPPSSSPSTASVSEARALVQKRKFNEALTILRPLARTRPDQANVLFLLGLVAIEASRLPDVTEAERDVLLDEATASLRTMLVDHPDLVRVRLELARAFFLKGEDSLSRDHFERVLAGNAAAGGGRECPALSCREIRSRRRWSMYLGGSVAPDTNIGAGSEERIIYIQGLPFRRDAEELTTSGVGVSVWTGGEYQYPLGERLRLRAGADISRREYSGSQVRSAGRVGPCRPALAGGGEHGGEPACQRPPPLDGQRARA